MADVLSSGGDPGRGRRPPTAALLLTALLLTAAAGTGYVASGHAGHGDRSAQPSAAPSPPSRAALRDPLPPRWLRCSTRCDAPALHAAAGRGPDGLRLLLDTTPLSVLDETGRRHRGPPMLLRRGEHIRTLLPMGPDVAALVQADNLSDRTPPGRIYRLAADGSVRLIGQADDLVQGIGGTVWTITYPRTKTAQPGPYILAELDRTGRVLRRHIEPPTIDVVRATTAGLLVTLAGVTDGSYFSQQESVWILNPATGQLDHSLSDAVFSVLDVTDDVVAWSSTRRPFVEVYDLGRGTVAGVFSAPGYHPPDYGRLSPDRRTLVLGFSGMPQFGTQPASYGYLAALDLTTRRTTPINGLRTPPKMSPQLEWTDDSENLILGINDRDARVAVWKRQQPGLTALPVLIPHNGYDFRFLALRPDGSVRTLTSAGN